MEQIFVINPKGGCGKTTISTQIAAHYAGIGVKVVLADHDAQRSSTDWASVRPANSPPIVCLPVAPEHPIDLGNAELVIHDMPAAWTVNQVNSVIHDGDRLIISVLPSPTDIKACLRFIMGLYREGVMEREIHTGLLANRVRTRTRYFSVLNDFLNRVDLPIIGELRDTQNYVKVMDQGLSIFDFPASTVAADLKQWEVILSWLDEHKTH